MTVITLTGPTCAGKSTVERELQRCGFGRAISHTTRNPRAGEVDGVHYHFVADSEFTSMELVGDFVEIVQIGSCRYAVSAAALLEAQGKNAHTVIVVDPHGAFQIKDFCKEKSLPYLSVWIDCDAGTQAKRWLHRLLGDCLIGEKAIDVYAERLSLMLTNEVEWRRNSDLYALNLDSSRLHSSTLAVMIKAEL